MHRRSAERSRKTSAGWPHSLKGVSDQACSRLRRLPEGVYVQSVEGVINRGPLLPAPRAGHPPRWGGIPARGDSWPLLTIIPPDSLLLCEKVCAAHFIFHTINPLPGAAPPHQRPARVRAIECSPEAGVEGAATPLRGAGRPRPDSSFRAWRGENSIALGESRFLLTMAGTDVKVG